MVWLKRMGLAIAVAATAMTAQAQAPEIVATPVPGVRHAVLYSQAGQAARPVIVILHGAEGGTEAGDRFGPILARQGYAAVGLPYYSPNWGEFGPPPALPDLAGSFIDIRIEQLADLREALRALPVADVERFGLLGASKGSEFALSAAARYDWIDAVVAYTPTDVVWEGWGLEMIEAEGTRSSFSFDGRALPFMPYRGFVEGLLAGPGQADLRAIHVNGRADHPEREAEARIPVEAFGGALLLVAGGKDSQWDSAAAASTIKVARDSAGRETIALVYPEAGHDLVGDGGPRDASRSGGTPEANAEARADAWPQVLAFLNRTLMQ